MSFGKTLLDIAGRLEKTFEKNADKAVVDPDDGSQATRDAGKAGDHAGSSAGDEANREARNREPAWKAAKDLSDKVIETAPKVEASAKHGWLTFVGVVTAIFTGAIFVASTQRPAVSPETQAARTVVRDAEDTRRQIAALDAVTLGMDDWNIMMGGLEAPSAPTPAETSAPPVAAAAPPPPIPAMAAELPRIIAAAAAEPMQVDVVTANGSRREFTTTVGNLYRQAPDQVRRIMTKSEAPPPIEHGYDQPDPNDCFVRHCLGGGTSNAGGFHRDFTVNAVDGNGNMFGSAHIHN
ncbi:MAG TPA: hypothetical protein VFW19_02505 [Allosphingosinicella sp.]|nr:hypothetical protein [Allosphingosinicella sp.]